MPMGVAVYGYVDDDSADEIFSEHFLEHIDYPHSAKYYVRNAHRVLVQGGRIITGVPDAASALSHSPGTLDTSDEMIERGTSSATAAVTLTPVSTSSTSCSATRTSIPSTPRTCRRTTTKSSSSSSPRPTPPLSNPGRSTRHGKSEAPLGQRLCRRGEIVPSPLLQGAVSGGRPLRNDHSSIRRR
jgi:hypothetical protein